MDAVGIYTLIKVLSYLTSLLEISKQSSGLLYHHSTEQGRDHMPCNLGNYILRNDVSVAQLESYYRV